MQPLTRIYVAPSHVAGYFEAQIDCADESCLLYRYDLRGLPAVYTAVAEALVLAGYTDEDLTGAQIWWISDVNLRRRMRQLARSLARS